MDFIKQWTLNICMTLIIAVVFSVLSPKGNIGKYYKIIIALFITLSFIYPFAENKMDFDFDLSSLEGYAQEYSEFDSTYESLIENQVKSLLEENNYQACNVSCSLSYNDNEITVKSITVTITDEYDCEKTEELIYNQLGFKAQVKYIGQ